MPKSNSQSSKSRKSGRKNQSASNAMYRIDQALTGSSDQDHFVKEDVAYKPLSPWFNVQIPKNIANQVVYIRQVVTDSLSSSTTTFTENNVVYTLTGYLNQATSYTNCFDQYYLAEAIMTVTNTAMISGNLADPIVYTAIDFDSAGNLGSVAAISAFGSCVASVLAGGQAITRYCKPCNSTSLITGTGAGVTRTWVDTSTPGVNFYGFRVLVNGAGSSASSTFSRTHNLVWCFRNNN
jgi:hypothetical protein